MWKERCVHGALWSSQAASEHLELQKMNALTPNQILDEGENAVENG